MMRLQALRPFFPRLFPLLAAAGLLALAGCGGSSSGSGSGGDSGTRVTVSIGGGATARTPTGRRAALVPSSVRTIRVTVQGPAMDDVVETLSVTGEGPFSVSLLVPSGPGRTFRVEALDGAGVIRYLGSSTVDVFGDRLDLAIRLELSPSNIAHSRWRFLNPAPTARDLYNVAFGNGTFVAVGASGTLLTSEDAGITWTARFADTGEALLGVAFGGGAFVAVGDAGGVFLSLDDGASWIRATTNDGGLATVTFGDGRFLSLGASPGVVSSVDGGHTWIPVVPEGLPALAQPRAATFGDGKFYALFDLPGSESPAELYSSPDGSTWTWEGVSVAAGSTGLAYGNSSLLVADLFGQIQIIRSGFDTISYYLTDGTDLHGAAFSAGGFAVVGDGGFLAVSSDPTLSDSWTDASADTRATLRGCAAGGGTVVAVGDGGMIVSSDGEVTDVRWSAQFTNDVGPVGFGGGVFVAGTSDGSAILRSTDDGAHWSSWVRSAPPIVGGPAVGPLAGFAFGGGAFVAVGPMSSKSPYPDPYPTPTLYVSTDGGATWSDEAGVISEDLTAVTYGAGTFVASTANDGVYRCQPPPTPESVWTWTRKAMPDPAEATISLAAVAYGGGVFVAAGSADSLGRVFTSADQGLTWSAVEGFSPSSLRQLVYADGVFVAIDGAGNAHTSADGTSWHSAGSIPLSDSSISGLAYGGGVLIVTDTLGSLYSSTDNAETWSEVPFRSPYGLSSVTFGDGAFLASGLGGMILRSEDL